MHKPIALNHQQLKHILVFTAQRIITLEHTLNQLDSCIGDGDHGSNMSRGCRSLLANMNNIPYHSLANACSAIGNILLSSIGGASGALYGTLLLTMGKHLPPNPSLEHIITAFDKGIHAIMILGNSTHQQKTLLDVLIPTANALKQPPQTPAQIAQQAQKGCKSTAAMQAQKGRASYLNERSIGHLDPGAYSSKIIICSICEVLTQSPTAPFKTHKNLFTKIPPSHP